MNAYLLVDIGSTYTKLTAVDIDAAEIIATSKHFTTVSTDVRDGYRKALTKLFDEIGKEIKFKKVYASSSAAGGLKMAAIGLVQELTVEAAKRVCLNAGGKVELIFSHYLTKNDLEKIKSSQIDIVLLAGGTDGGNTSSVIHNAKMLAEAKLEMPIIYAGNKSCQDEIKEIFDNYNVNVYICDNVMPKLNVLHIDSSRDVIKKIFLENIISARGIDKLSAEIDGIMFPTPGAVLKAMEILSTGYGSEVGLGELILVDIGGATTDIYSIASGSPKMPNAVNHGLEEPFAKRTVEGDLGMRYSAEAILSNLTDSEISKYLSEGIDLRKEAIKRFTEVSFIPTTKEDEKIDKEFAKLCTSIAFSRHVGTIESVYTPVGVMYYQRGKDLTEVQTIIGTGGVIVHSNNPTEILSNVEVNHNKPQELRPKNPNYFVDKDYILSAMGLLSIDYPEVAIKIMKKRIVRIWN